jgi:hypothetical protein
MFTADESNSRLSQQIKRAAQPETVGYTSPAAGNRSFCPKSLTARRTQHACI